MTSHNITVKTSIHCASLLSAGPFICHSSFHPASLPHQTLTRPSPWQQRCQHGILITLFLLGAKGKWCSILPFSSFCTVWHQLGGVHENASMLSLLHLSVAMHRGAVCTVHECTAANSLWLGHVWMCSGQMENTNHCVNMTSVMGECSSPAFCHSFFWLHFESCHWLEPSRKTDATA